MNRVAVVVILAGLAGLTYGVWQVSRPAAYIVAGCLLAGLGLLMIDVKPRADR